MAHTCPFGDLTSHIFPPPEFAIIGAGVGGLVTAAMFERARIPYVVLEKRDNDAHLDGADVALYPTSIQILSELGVPATFWPEHSSPVKSVHICRAKTAKDTALTAAAGHSRPVAPMPPASGNGKYHDPVHAAASNSLVSLADTIKMGAAAQSGYGGDAPLLTPAQAAISTLAAPPPIKTLNFDNILGEHQVMRMTNRRALMRELQRLVPRSKCLLGATVIQLTEQAKHIELIFTYQSAFAQLTVPIVIGADGVKSVARQTVQRGANNMARPPRYAGEICWRGSIDFTKDEKDPVLAALKAQLSDLFVKEDWQKPNSVSLYYARDRRSSWGFLNESGSVGYWWVRERWAGSRDEFTAMQRKQEDMPQWPEPLRSLYRLTNQHDYYLQPIVDREHDRATSEWHTARCVLLGDAAHPATPELFQGANLAVEDAAMLAGLIASCPPSTPPAKIFAEFAAKRLKHVTRIQKMSYSQTKLSQLQSKPTVMLRNAALKLIPTRLLESRLRKTAAWDPNAASVVHAVTHGPGSGASAVGVASSRASIASSSASVRWAHGSSAESDAASVHSAIAPASPSPSVLATATPSARSTARYAAGKAATAPSSARTSYESCDDPGTPRAGTNAAVLARPSLSNLRSATHKSAPTIPARAPSPRGRRSGSFAMPWSRHHRRPSAGSLPSPATTSASASTSASSSRSPHRTAGRHGGYELDDAASVNDQELFDALDDMEDAELGMAGLSVEDDEDDEDVPVSARGRQGKPRPRTVMRTPPMSPLDSAAFMEGISL
ncbi:hypothetical protein AMAG_07551 [Allomyces macrogynus ATCC 38327]|uniref:FAD-binding domain-containing protein n=1 Tax=Allomyces macrogynus (strain ATCC 38327) TaxID=578462 RepID=A0A0L0SIX8_ALLM3|nr:hypothetical protein AMAG_07551 [Allomyces macrogynus ATCC 38327]|eukprot:KNE62320.1 hypothetical protein AMAG_07551 [Allomyces macrogynus ATCC 38327]